MLEAVPWQIYSSYMMYGDGPDTTVSQQAKVIGKKNDNNDEGLSRTLRPYHLTINFLWYDNACGLLDATMALS